MPEPAQDILSIFIADGRVTKEQSDSIRQEALTSGSTVDDILVRKHYVTDYDVRSARAKLFGIAVISLTGKAISPDAINYIPEPVARRYTLIPFQYDSVKNELTVAMIDPFDVQVVEFLEKKSGKRILPTLATKEDIIAAIDTTYAQNLGADVSAALKEAAPNEVKTYEAGRLGQVIREAPIAQIVSAILEQSIRLRASDIHIEPQPGDTRVRFRVDGILLEKLALPRGLHDAVVSRIKILAELKIDEKRIPQDGRFNFKMGVSEVDLRVSTLPTSHGEKVVMRLLKKSGGVPTLQELGLRGLALKNLETAILRPHGVVLVTGPTGSGKSTTLYAVLSKLNNTRVNIVTLEDPVEYEVPGINQVQVNPQAGLTFSSGLRAFLRQDPNIILVGEIRDTETTDLAIQAALTGHLVFSTLHTNNAAGAIPRLLDLGAEPFLVASAINAIVGQRICRKVCPACREEYAPEQATADDIRKVLGKLLPADKPIKLYRGKGKVNDQPCSTCNGTTYIGRIGIYEVFTISDAISKLVLTRTPMKTIEDAAISEGMITLKQDGYMKAVEGVTSLEEVLRVAQD